ncbi:hypothetical protein VNO78_25240 [Psophocarpus tetragonolobus]|uniref:Uncharacterized protein n=1 Tax=Psophocarpus tetragonolobus TaxID=3891 RepID=A0AAN9S9R9_PSOTE
MEVCDSKIGNEFPSGLTYSVSLGCTSQFMEGGCVGRAYFFKPGPICEIGGLKPSGLSRGVCILLISSPNVKRGQTPILPFPIAIVEVWNTTRRNATQPLFYPILRKG